MGLLPIRFKYSVLISVPISPVVNYFLSRLFYS